MVRVATPPTTMSSTSMIPMVSVQYTAPVSDPINQSNYLYSTFSTIKMQHKVRYKVKTESVMSCVERGCSPPLTYRMLTTNT